MVLSFKQFLQEKIIHVDSKDIDLIYKPLEPIIREATKILGRGSTLHPDQRGLIEEFGEEYRNKYKELLQTIPSSRLRSTAAKLATEINPVKIEIFSRHPGNLYDPRGKVINLGPTNNAVSGLANIRYVARGSIAALKAEWTELRIKATIRHELTHWLDDSLNNLHMSDIAKTNIQRFGEYLKAGQRDVALGHIEVEAVVSTIAEIKRQLGKNKYEELTWDDLMALHPAIGVLNRELGAPWRRKIASRLARERLLGKNMRF